MRNILILFLCFVSAFTTAQTVVNSTGFTISAKEKVIASTVGANKHVYVFTAPKGEYEGEKYKLKGKVTLHHFDENKKLILKKVIVVPAIDGARLVIDATFEIGGSLTVFGTADGKKEVRTTAYFTVDETTLVASRTATEIMTNKYSTGWMGNSPNKMTYSQSIPGSPVALYIYYGVQTSIDEGNSRFTSKTDYFSAYFAVDTKGEFQKVLAFENSTDEVDRSHEDFLMSADGSLYIFTILSPHYEYDWENHEITKESKKQLINGEYRMVLDRYTVATKEKLQMRVQFSDETLLTDDIELFDDEGGVYMAGMCDNGTHNYIRILREDTAGAKFQQYFYTQHIDPAQTSVKIEATNYKLIEDEFLDQYTKDKSLSEEDRDIGNHEQLYLIGCQNLKDGSTQLVYGMGIFWTWPPYAEIKNNKAYSFTVDESGDIVSVTGPGGSRRMEYSSLLVFNYNTTNNTITATTKPMVMDVIINFVTNQTSPTYRILGRSAGENYIAIYPNEKDKKTSLESTHTANGPKTYINYPGELTYAPGCAYTVKSSILVLNGQKEFLIVDLLE